MVKTTVFVYYMLQQFIIQSVFLAEDLESYDVEMYNLIQPPVPPRQKEEDGCVLRV